MRGRRVWPHLLACAGVSCLVCAGGSTMVGAGPQKHCGTSTRFRNRLSAWLRGCPSRASSYGLTWPRPGSGDVGLWYVGKVSEIEATMYMGTPITLSWKATSVKIYSQR